MINSIAFAADSLTHVRTELLSQSPDEGAAVFVAGHSLRPKRTRLLVRQIEIPGADALLQQNDAAIVISPTFLAPLIKLARLERFSVIIAHTHPFSTIPRFSQIDDAGELKLMPAIFNRAPNAPHGAIVFGTEGFDARVWTTPQQCVPVHDIQSVGKTLRLYPKDEDIPSPSARFDRNIRAFGELGQNILRGLKVGIVGLGGIGSIVAQQLSYLGVRNFVVLDMDTIDESNLNRLVSATRKDVGRSKVDAASDLIFGVTVDAEVQALKGSAVRANDALPLLDCDFVFCCTDSHGSRAVLNAIAYQYYIPVIDSGVRIDASNGIVTAISGRVQMLSPGLPCLVCQNLLDPEEVRRDLLSEDERRRDPYIVGHSEVAPAVISLNGVIASLSVSMFLSATVGMGSEARHQMYLGRNGVVRAVDAVANPNCVICSLRGALGRGDSWNLPWRTA